MLGQDVVEGEVATAPPAVLAALLIALEDLAAGESRTGVGAADEVAQADHTRRDVERVLSADQWVFTFGQDVGFAVKDEDERTPHRAHVEWLVVLVQHQGAALDRHRFPSPRGCPVRGSDVWPRTGAPGGRTRVKR